MKRLLIFFLVFGLAVAIAGALLRGIMEVGSGAIGSVSSGFAEAVIELAVVVIVVVAILAGRALWMRVTHSNTSPKS